MLKRLIDRGVLKVSEEIRDVLQTKSRGVVALESTVITHGLPYPHNLKTAISLERIIREHNAVPATIGILNGRLTVGLTTGEIEHIAQNGQEAANKVSRRDIATTLVQGKMGGTTVAGTMIAAKMAGIDIFATGGLGGVHRGAEESWDVSADLEELSRTPVHVVCAGAKSILDIPKTLEYLETKGVPVITFGDTSDFPGFFTPTSGCVSAHRFGDILELAKFIDESSCLGLENGSVIACPIPSDHAKLGEFIESKIQIAVKEAQEQNIKSREVTPFILKRVNELTKGESLTANIALLENNARIAANLSNALADIKKSDKGSGGGLNNHWIYNESHRIPIAGFPKSENQPATGSSLSNPKPDVVVFGGCNLDFYLNITDPNFKEDGGGYSGEMEVRAGGVGRNVADGLTKLGTKTTLVSAVGDDYNGQILCQLSNHMDLSQVQTVRPNGVTPIYTGIMSPDGNILFGIQNSMSVLNSIFASKPQVERYAEIMKSSKMVVLDGNVSVESMNGICSLAEKASVPIWFEPADKYKGRKIVESKCWSKISYASPNAKECVQLFDSLRIPISPEDFSNRDQLAGKLNDFTKTSSILNHLECLLITLASDGILTRRRNSAGAFEIEVFDTPVVTDQVISVSGAGDCLNCGIISSLVSGETDWKRTIQSGLSAAREALLTHQTVPSSFTFVSK